MTTSYTFNAPAGMTEIRFNRENREFDIFDDGRYITSAPTFPAAEAKRMEYLASLRGQA